MTRSGTRTRFLADRMKLIRDGKPDIHMHHAIVDALADPLPDDS